MKKLTAALSAAAIAVTMAVPFTASAATSVNGVPEQTKLNYDFADVYVGGDWTMTGTTSGNSNQDKLMSAVEGGQLKLFNSTDKLIAITKTNQRFFGDYTLSFDVTTPTAVTDNKVDAFACYIMDNDVAYGAAQHKLEFARNSSATSNAVYVKCDNEILKFTGKDSTAYVKPEKTYHFEYTVSNGSYLLTVTGGDWGQNTVTKSGTMEVGYNFTSGLRFANNTQNGTGLSFDNIKVVINQPIFTADNITDGKYVGDDNTITVSSTRLLSSIDTERKITMTKDEEPFNDFSVVWEDFSVVWADSTSTVYKVNPTITFNSAPAAGTYVLSFDVKDAYGYTSKPSWTFTVDGPAVVEPSATTTHVDASCSVVIEGIVITNGNDIVCNGQTVQFFRTDITAGTNAVNGGTITAATSNATATQEYRTSVEAGQTGSFYNAVTFNGDPSDITWTYTFN